MQNYVTLEYLPQDEELANKIADKFADKAVDTKLFEKNGDHDHEAARVAKRGACLVILHLSEDFDYRDYLKELNACNNKCQIVAIYKNKTVYQNRITMNEITYDENMPVEILVDQICCLIVGGYYVRVTAFNRNKLKDEAIRLYNSESYVWALGLFLRVFKIHDAVIKEKIADAYTKLMNCDKAINYYSICLPTTDQDTQAVICNNLGYLYTQTKNLEFAERYLKQAVEFQHPDALFNLAYLYETSWAYDSGKKRLREAYDLYCKVLELPYTSEASKAEAKIKLKLEADKLLKRKNYAAAMTYYKAIGDGAKVAECLRDIKLLRMMYEERKKKLSQ